MKQENPSEQKNQAKMANDENQEVLKLAEQGDAEAQNKVGMLYRDAIGVEKNDAEAVKWFRKSAEQGFADALCNLANMYYYGMGVEQDYKKAFELTFEAAKQGYARALNNLGVMYENGNGVGKNIGKAVEWFCKAIDKYSEAALQGDMNAKGAIFNILKQHSRLPQSEKIELYFHAAEQYFFKVDKREWSYTYSYSRYEEEDDNMVNDFDDFDDSMDDFDEQPSADDDTDWTSDDNAVPETQSCSQPKMVLKTYEETYYFDSFLNNFLESISEYNDNSVWLIRKSAEYGLSVAQFKLGYLYENGINTKRDYAQAVEWYQKAIAQKYHEYHAAEYRLGMMYEAGLGVKQDYAKAFELYCKAERYSYSAGIDRKDLNYRLGLMYEKGRGTKRNLDKAVECYRQIGSNRADYASVLNTIFTIGPIAAVTFLLLVIAGLVSRFLGW